MGMKNAEILSKPKLQMYFSQTPISIEKGEMFLYF